MQVRPPTPRELSAVAELHTAAAEAGGRRAYDESTTAAWAKRGERGPDDYPVDDPASHFVVAVTDRVCGFGEVVPEVGEVRAVYVHPDCERRGVGTALLAHVEGYARGRGVESLSLQSSLNAVGFYETAGYEADAAEASPGGIEVVRMEKSL